MTKTEALILHQATKLYEKDKEVELLMELLHELMNNSRQLSNEVKSIYETDKNLLHNANCTAQDVEHTLGRIKELLM
jgi:uncharacterized protein YoxC